MKQEYLFTNDGQREELEKYNPNDEGNEENHINVTFKDIDQSTSFILTFETGANNEAIAKKLSEVDQYITGHYSPIVLESGISVYFDQMLFPKINKFERLLRELLYLMATINQDKSASNNIRDLEKKDFGELFKLLFTDENFMNQVRSRINKKGDSFTKKQLQNQINNIAENTTWSRLSGDKFSPTLAESFDEIREYRNDVMHAHNINYQRFKKGKELLDKTNKELQTAVDNIIGAKERVPEDFNNNLSIGIESLAKAMELIANESNIEKVVQNLSIYAKALDQVMQKVGLASSPSNEEK